MTILQAMKKWGIKHSSQVYQMLKANRVEGAYEDALNHWVIPDDLERPIQKTRGRTTKSIVKPRKRAVEMVEPIKAIPEPVEPVKTEMPSVINNNN